ncbi:fructosamine kinase family protein [Pacificispira sp.]|uniref:fructosamine kinase family protein n=1 Tax=Pacificispira sp. TaxID=2888761 RepID=UPI003B5303DE
MTPDLRRRLERILGSAIAQSRPLSGGNIAECLRIVTQDGRAFAVKSMAPLAQPTDLPQATLKDEAFMLDRLRASGKVPVPAVHHVDRDLMVLEFIPCDDGVAASTEQECLADIVADLHSVTVPRYGFDRPTPVGPLQRPNDWSDTWVPFLRDRRLMFLGRLAHDAGRLPDGCLARLERLCARLEDWIPERGAASLIHGDLWIGNILFKDRKVAALIDPACYFADPEIELAFLTLFGGVGEAFFDRYREHRPVDPLFFQERRTLYHLEPLLAHAWFFGGGYGMRADEILIRYLE